MGFVPHGSLPDKLACSTIRQLLAEVGCSNEGAMVKRNLSPACETSLAGFEVIIKAGFEVITEVSSRSEFSLDPFGRAGRTQEYYRKARSRTTGFSTMEP